MEHLPQKDFNPRIWVFLCDCCLNYPEFEKAALGFSFPASIIKVEEMCISLVHSEKVRQAFESGADGVLLAGCHLGQCKRGNNVERLQLIHQHHLLLKDMGIEPKRLGQSFTAPGTGKTLQVAFSHFLEGIREMGPAMRPGMRPELKENSTRA